MLVRCPGEAPADGYTLRDIWRKGAGRGLAADPASGSGRLPCRGHGPCAWATVMPGSPARYTLGPSGVHARSVALRIRELRRQMSPHRGCRYLVAEPDQFAL